MMIYLIGYHKSITKGQIMANMNKTQTWDAVLRIIEDSKIAKGTKSSIISELEEILAPKKGGGSSAHPPMVDENGNITDAWCKYHQTYEPISDMVVDKEGKSKGYCKAASAISNKRRKQVKDLKLQALSIMGDDVEKAQDLVKQAEAIEPTINNPEFYNLGEDWAEFESK